MHGCLKTGMSAMTFRVSLYKARLRLDCYAARTRRSRSFLNNAFVAIITVDTSSKL